MLRKLIIVVTLCTAWLTVKANDGAYLSSGSIIYPVSETSVSMEKEILSFTCSDKMAYVNIYFEFLNPEKTEKKILMGFQAPYPSGDVNFSVRSKPPIENFKVLTDGKLIPYNLKSAKCENCELIEPSEMVINEFTSGIYVYLFEVTFKPGINVINHSYNFHASSQVYLEETYSYILKTGSKWAGGTIRDFTLQVDMGANSYFFIKDLFPDHSSWKIVGAGKVTEKYNKMGSDKNTNRMVRISSGKLEINVKDFKPSENIFFGIFSKNSFFTDLLHKKIVPGKIIRAMGSLTINFKNYPESYSIEELKILRNAVYAQHGYIFKNAELQNYFMQFDWYLPDPNLKEDNIGLTEREKMFINEITEKEKYLRN